MILEGGVFAKSYGDAANLTTRYTWCEYGSTTIREWWEAQGYTFVCNANITFDPLSREAAIKGEVEALGRERDRKRAEVENECTVIQGRINRLLALEYIPAERGEFAPRSNGDVTDVPHDDIPF